MSTTGSVVERLETTAGDFAHVAGALPSAVRKLAAMQNRNDKTPQGRLEFIVAQALFRIDAEVGKRESPPHEFFKSAVVLEELRGALSDYRSAQMKKEGYTVFTQLIASEITAIDDCLSGSCIAKANSALEAYQNNNSIAKPSVKMKVVPPSISL
tara:strand:+ start:1024 stop:1488 length:465 start_codon:yes stop_codon:yes gene_type:complete